MYICAQIDKTNNKPFFSLLKGLDSKAVWKLEGFLCILCFSGCSWWTVAQGAMTTVGGWDRAVTGASRRPAAPWYPGKQTAQREGTFFLCHLCALIDHSYNTPRGLQSRHQNTPSLVNEGKRVISISEEWQMNVFLCKGNKHNITELSNWDLR